MGFNTFFNYEIVSINIIQDCIDKLEDLSNIEYEEQKRNRGDIFAVENNIKYASVAIVFIADLYESAINTIIGRRLKIDGEDVLKLPTEVQLAIICRMYNIDYNYIKGLTYYKTYTELKKIRNDFIHYKKNHIGQGLSLVGQFRIPFGSIDKLLIEIIDKKQVEKYYNDVFKLIEVICDKCNLGINSDCEMIDSDARANSGEFIFQK